MKIFNYLKSLIGINLPREPEKGIQVVQSQETPEQKKEIPEQIVSKQTNSTEKTERLLTVSQAAKDHGVTRQAIFFAIKMKRLNACKENDTWLITESDLKEYFDNKYSRSKSRVEGELIFDKSKGFYSISEAADFLGKNTNHIYYLVRMGKLKTHRQGSAIVIQDIELYKYAEFVGKKTEKTLCNG